MYTVIRHADNFDLEDPTAKERYEKIINDPLCTIVTERIEKIREEEFNEDTGRLSRSFERILRVIVWEQKVLHV